MDSRVGGMPRRVKAVPEPQRGRRNIYVLETRHGQDDASTSLQIVRSKLVVMLIVFFFANRVVVACQIEPAKTQVSRT